MVAVVADRELRIARILARDAITREQAELRLSRQHDDEFFRAHADFVIENNYGEHNPDGGALERRVREILPRARHTGGGRGEPRAKALYSRFGATFGAAAFGYRLYNGVGLYMRENCTPFTMRSW